MSGATQAQLNDLLLKKILGAAWTTIEQPPTLEASGSAMTKIPASLIMNQPIPTQAPLASDMGSSTTLADGGTYCSSLTAPYIQQYTKLSTTTVTPGTCFKGADNQLSQAIPFNYDPAGGYSMTVYVNNVSQPSNLWYFDGSSGYLTFFSSIGLTYNPTISFWRYAGTYGLVTGSTGPQGITGPQGSTGDQGSTGPQGLQGQTTIGPKGGQGDKGGSPESTLAENLEAITAAAAATAAAASAGWAVICAISATESATTAEDCVASASTSATAAANSASDANVSAAFAEAYAEEAKLACYSLENTLSSTDLFNQWLEQGI